MFVCIISLQNTNNCILNFKQVLFEKLKSYVSGRFRFQKLDWKIQTKYFCFWPTRIEKTVNSGWSSVLGYFCLCQIQLDISQAILCNMYQTYQFSNCRFSKFPQYVLLSIDPNIIIPAGCKKKSNFSKIEETGGFWLWSPNRQP